MRATRDHRHRLVILADAAVDHIVDDHPEMEPHLDGVLRAVERPTVHRSGRATNEEWYFLEGAGPARWLHVVVHFFGEEGSVTTAFGRSRLP